MMRPARRLLAFSLVVFASLIADAALAAARRPMDPQLAQALERILGVSDENPEEALQSLDRLMTSYRRRPHQQVYIMQLRAGLLFQEEQYEAAREEIADLLRDQPPGFAPTLRFTYAKVLLVLDQADAALVMLEQWREHDDTPTSEGFFLLGYAYVRLERFEQAVAPLEMAVERVRKPAATWIELLAFAYARSGRSEEAIALIDELIRDNPAKANWWRHLATLYQSIDETSKGTAALAVVDLLGELTLLETRNLASMMGYLGMPYEAAKLLASRLESADEPAASEASAGKGRYADLMLLGKLWMSAREFDRATAALQRASALAEDGQPHVLIGQLHLHWERHAEALAAFNQAVKAYGEDIPPRVFYLIAIAAMNLDDAEEARLALLQIEDDKAYGQRAARLIKQLTAMQVRAGG